MRLAKKLVHGPRNALAVRDRRAGQRHRFTFHHFSRLIGHQLRRAKRSDRSATPALREMLDRGHLPCAFAFEAASSPASHTSADIDRTIAPRRKC